MGDERSLAHMTDAELEEASREASDYAYAFASVVAMATAELGRRWEREKSE